MAPKKPKPAKHLIGKIQDRPIVDVFKELTAARAYLAGQGMHALRNALEIDATESWGSAVKRRRVHLPPEGRPAIIPEAVTDHSLIEIMNQCATLDRLLDAMSWVRKDDRLSAYQTVKLCHPTTSSSKSNELSDLDNDLILTDGNGRRARFEVSDVASEKDGNGKELRDLISLGVVRDCNGSDRLKIEKWPDGLLFLVVSSEFATGVLSRKPSWIKQSHLKYVEINASTGTTLLEIVRGGDLSAKAQ